MKTKKITALVLALIMLLSPLRLRQPECCHCYN